MIKPGLLRLFLALVVVLHHSTPLRMGGWAVYVFLILSGYWIARIWDQRYQHTRQPVMTFLISRWWRLAPVMFSCLAIIFVTYRFNGWSLPELTPFWVLKQLPIAGSMSGQRILPPQWSLDVEMQFYWAAAILLPLQPWLHGFPLGRSAGLPCAVLVCLISAIYIILGGFPDSPLLWPWFGFFLIGIWIWRSHWVPSVFLTVAGTSTFLIVTASLMISRETRSGLIVTGASASGGHFCNWPILWQEIGSLCMAPFLAMNLRTPSSKLDRFFGNWAYPLYLFHWVPREWYYRNVNWAMPWWDSVALLLANIAVALAGSLVILWVIDRPMDHLRTLWVKSRLLSV